MSRFADAFMDARRRIEHGEDPDVVVPPLLDLAEAPEEIELAKALYGEDEDDDTMDLGA